MALPLPLLPLLLLATPSPIPPIHTYLALHGGRPSVLTILHTCLGLQVPLNPSTLNHGEYPACAAMTTGYVFRVENQATVMFLQRAGRTGYLTTLEVLSASSSPKGRMFDVLPIPLAVLLLTKLLTSFSPTSTPLLLSLLSLFTSRLLSTISLHIRTTPSWHGMSEPNVKGDLLILLSSDRWIRMLGLVDDLKAVTSGSWLSRPRRPELLSALDWIASLLIYICAIVLSAAPSSEQFLLVGTVVLGHIALMYQVSHTEELRMNGRVVRISKSKDGSENVKKYARRLDMAEELVGEVGRRDFAVRLGMINPEQLQGKQGSASEKPQTGKNDVENEVVTM